jgi:hypothetical protein
MDPRGATALVEDPRGALDALRDRRSLALPHTDEARDRAESASRSVADALRSAALEDGVSTCVFGSWARGELTPESDHDWAVLVAGGSASDGSAEFALASAHLGIEGYEPGSQGTFAVPIFVDNLVDNIGLDDDTNTNLTQRMLLLLESRELHGRVRDEAIARLLGRYLEGAKPRSIPRFLLNDIVRYWRTICVDFEGKAAKDSETDPKWATRNAKLRTSRKLLFAGGLVSVFLCDQKTEEDDMRAFLTRWLDVPPLDRLAAAFLHAADLEPEILDAAVRTFTAYERWLSLISQESTRSALRDVTPADRDISPLFQTIRDIGREFEAGLIALLFSRAFEDKTRSAAIF